VYSDPLSGTVEVYSSDDSTGEWTLAHTLQFTRRQFPGNHSSAE
jgi:6-phosphogluconolactonase (cycloisomerase 2 family)